METGDHFSEPEEAPVPRPLGEQEWIDAVREREVREEKSPITAASFWRVILGGLHSEVVDRYDEQGYRGLSLNDPS